MDMEESSIKNSLYMKELLKTDREMVLGLKFTKTQIFIWENLKVTEKMDLESTSLKMDIIMASLKTMSEMGMGVCMINNRN